MSYSSEQMLIGDFKPRVIVWQLTNNDNDYPKHFVLLEKHQNLLIINSIASLSKPIVIFTGKNVINHPDIFEIIEYGNALGLKFIIELIPDDVNESVIEHFKCYGKRIFRLIVNNSITEDFDQRFKSTEAFSKLEKAVKILRDNSFELHFSYTITKPDIRKLSFVIDYAFRKAAHGLYCHLRFDKTVHDGLFSDDTIFSLDEFISKLSEMKNEIPNRMYLSPQCVRYIRFSEDYINLDVSSDAHPQWTHQCLAGKTFAFINQIGKVFVCGGICNECGDLKKTNYDFRYIWLNSEIMNQLRLKSRSCVQTRLLFKKQNVFNFDRQTINEQISE